MNKTHTGFPTVPTLKNKDFSIYSMHGEVKIKALLSLLTKSKSDMLGFLKLEDKEQITVNIYDNEQDYMKFARRFYDGSEEPICHLTGNTIPFFATFRFLRYNEEEVSKLIMHRYAHILISKHFPEAADKVWLSEGLASFLSHVSTIENQAFSQQKAYYLNKIICWDREIPDDDFVKLTSTDHDRFTTDKYNGQYFSCLLVKYLLETRGDFFDLLKNREKLSQIEPTLVKDAVEYFNKKYKVSELKEDYYQINTPEEFMDFLNKNTSYGYLGKDGNVHTSQYGDMKELYQSMTVEQILKHHVGTCADKAIIIKDFFDKHGYTNKLYYSRAYDSTKHEIIDRDYPDRVHFFLLYKDGEKWKHFEQANEWMRGIFEYDNCEEAVDKISQSMSEGLQDSTHTFEISNIPTGLSYRDVNRYMNRFEKKEEQASMRTN